MDEPDDKSGSDPTILPSRLIPSLVEVPKGRTKYVTAIRFPLKLILAGSIALDIHQVPEELWGESYILVDPVRFSGDPSVDVFFPIREDGELLIGRAQTPPLFVVEQTARVISRLHCGITRKDNRFAFRDCNSKNGTSIYCF